MTVMKAKLFALLLASGSHQAMAQTTATAATPPIPPADSAAAADGPQSDGVSDIVVVANRREERLQEVPVAITAIAGDTLARSGVVSTSGLTQVAPALNFVRTNTSFQPIIRGVGTRNTSIGDESNVSVYVDGVYQPVSSGVGMDLLEIERVEVLRGPQGTLFGRNSTGGLINIITADPSFTFKGKAEVSYGRFNELAGKLYLSGPLSDTLAVDFSGYVHRDDGYIRDIVRNRNIGGRNSEAVRSKLLFKPSEKASVTFSFGYAHGEDAAIVDSLPLNGNTVARKVDPNVVIPSRPYTAAPSIPRYATNSQYNASMETRFDLGGVLLETTGGWSRSRVTIGTDEDGTPIDVQRVEVKPRSEYFSQEVRLISDTPSSKFKWIVGGFVFGGVGSFQPVNIYANGALVQVLKTRMATQSYAAFGEGTLELVPNLFVTAGLRYTYEKQQFEGTAATAAGVILTNTPEQRNSDGKFTYRGTIRYEFSRNLNVYATYSRGFKSGLFNTFSAANLPPVKPETLDSIEGGIKSNPASWLRMNLSVFHYNYKDIQLSGRSPNGASTLLNAASAKLSGGEIEIALQPDRDFSFTAYATYLDAHYTSFPNAQLYLPNYIVVGGVSLPAGNSQVIADVSGSEVMRSPKYSFGLNGSYEHDFGSGKLDASANLFISGRYFWDVNNRLYQPAYTKLNADLGWTFSNKLRVGVWGQNLTDAVVYTQLVPAASADLAAFERPRTYGVRVSLKF